jgi:hypothetical protein
MKRRRTESDLVAAMIDAGATFRFTPGGSLIADGLGDLPGDLRQAFYESGQREFIAAVRARADLQQVAAEKKARQAGGVEIAPALVDSLPATA